MLVKLKLKKAKHKKQKVGTLYFDLTDYDNYHAFMRASKADDFCYALQSILESLMNFRKYRDEDSVEDLIKELFSIIGESDFERHYY